MLNRVLVFLENHLLRDLLAEVDHEWRFQVRRHLRDVVTDRQEGEYRRLVHVIELEFAELLAREANRVVGLENFRFKQRNREFRILERLEPNDQNIVARIDEAEFRVIRET